MTYVYLLKLSNGNIYKGSTENLKRRLKEHEDGQVCSTKAHRPLKCIGFEGYLVRSDALRREKFLKTTEGGRLLKQQYKDVLQGEVEPVIIDE